MKEKNIQVSQKEAYQNAVFLLEKGKLIDKGNYQYLMGSNQIFKRMAREESEKNIIESQKIS